MKAASSRSFDGGILKCRAMTDLTLLSIDPDIETDGGRREASDHNLQIVGLAPEDETAAPGLGGGDGDGAGRIGSDDGIAGLREDSAGLDEDGRDAVALRDFECLAFVEGLNHTVHQLTVAHLITNCKRIHLPPILPHRC